MSWWDNLLPENDLSTRAKNCLCNALYVSDRHHQVTPEEVASKGWRFWICLPNCGRGTVKELEIFLQQHGIKKWPDREFAKMKDRKPVDDKLHGYLPPDQEKKLKEEHGKILADTFNGFVSGPDPFESAVVGIIRLLAPWPAEERAKILQATGYCFICGRECNKHSCIVGINCDGVQVRPEPDPPSDPAIAL